MNQMVRNPQRSPFDPMTGLHGQQGLSQLFYTYVLNFGNLAASATGNQAVNITTDADFVWCETTFLAYEHAAAVPMSDAIIRPFTLQINDGGISHGMFNNPVPIDCIAGTSKFPFILPLAYTFARGASISGTLVSLDAANQWDNCYLALIGYKDFTNSKSGH